MWLIVFLLLFLLLLFIVLLFLVGAVKVDCDAYVGIANGVIVAVDAVWVKLCDSYPQALFATSK